MTTTITTSFAKIFELPDNRQLAAYIDPREDHPGVVFISEVSGVPANTRLNIESKNGKASVEEQREGLAALLSLIDEEKATEISSILQETLNNHIPHLKIIDEIAKISGEVRQPFARIVEGPSGESILLIRGSDRGIPYLEGITSQEIFKTQPPSVEERNHLFLHNQQLPSILPPSILNHLGIAPPTPSAGRKPGM